MNNEHVVSEGLSSPWWGGNNYPIVGTYENRFGTIGGPRCLHPDSNSTQKQKPCDEIMKSHCVGVLLMGMAKGLSMSTPSQKPLHSRRLVLSTISTAALTSLLMPGDARAEIGGSNQRKYQR